MRDDIRTYLYALLDERRDYNDYEHKSKFRNEIGRILLEYTKGEKISDNPENIVLTADNIEEIYVNIDIDGDILAKQFSAVNVIFNDTRRGSSTRKTWNGIEYRYME